MGLLRGVGRKGRGGWASQPPTARARAVQSRECGRGQHPRMCGRPPPPSAVAEPAGGRASGGGEEPAGGGGASPPRGRESQVARTRAGERQREGEPGRKRRERERKRERAREASEGEPERENQRVREREGGHGRAPPRSCRRVVSSSPPPHHPSRGQIRALANAARRRCCCVESGAFAGTRRGGGAKTAPTAWTDEAGARARYQGGRPSPPRTTVPRPNPRSRQRSSPQLPSRRIRRSCWPDAGEGAGETLTALTHGAGEHERGRPGECASPPRTLRGQISV